MGDLDASRHPQIFEGRREVPRHGAADSSFDEVEHVLVCLLECKIDGKRREDCESYTPETHAYEVHAHEMHAYEVDAHERHTRDMRA